MLSGLLPEMKSSYLAALSKKYRLSCKSIEFCIRLVLGTIEQFHKWLWKVFSTRFWLIFFFHEFEWIDENVSQSWITLNFAMYRIDLIYNNRFDIWFKQVVAIFSLSRGCSGKVWTRLVQVFSFIRPIETNQPITIKRSTLYKCANSFFFSASLISVCLSCLLMKFLKRQNKIGSKSN